MHSNDYTPIRYMYNVQCTNDTAMAYSYHFGLSKKTKYFNFFLHTATLRCFLSRSAQIRLLHKIDSSKLNSKVFLLMQKIMSKLVQLLVLKNTIKSCSGENKRKQRISEEMRKKIQLQITKCVSH